MSVRDILLNDVGPFVKKHGVIIAIVIVGTLLTVFAFKHVNHSPVPIDETQEDMNRELSGSRHPDAGR